MNRELVESHRASKKSLTASHRVSKFRKSVNPVSMSVPYKHSHRRHNKSKKQPHRRQTKKAASVVDQVINYQTYLNSTSYQVIN